MRTPRRITDNNARRVAEDLLKQIDVVDSKLKNVSSINTNSLSGYSGDVKILTDKINEILNAINK
tara:strand:- start:1213 stop:1407 length:195 start_codon:yes stop_codon:yes gene_type:complete